MSHIMYNRSYTVRLLFFLTGIGRWSRPDVKKSLMLILLKAILEHVKFVQPSVCSLVLSTCLTVVYVYYIDAIPKKLVLIKNYSYKATAL